MHFARDLVLRELDLVPIQMRCSEDPRGNAPHWSAREPRNAMS